MPRFRYKAVTPAGEVVEGALEAPSRAAVIDRLRGQGHMPIRAEAVADRTAAPWWRRSIRFSTGLSQPDIILITRELATLLQAGLPLDRAIAMSAELEAEGPRLQFLQAVLERVRGGVPLAEALAQQKAPLPSFYVGMIRAGEAGNTLDAVLARLADTLERAQALRESIRSAMYYPIIVLVVAGVTLTILLTAVVPEFKPLFEDSGAALPTAMAVLLAAGDFLKAWWWALLVGIVALVLLLRQYRRSVEGRLRWDRFVSRLPLFGDLVLKIEVARFARTLGTLLGNGVTALPAFTIAVGAIGNRAIARAIEAVRNRLQRGEGLAVPLLETGAFPRLAAQLVQVGEESGQLEAMLLRVADIYDVQVKRTLDRLLSLLVPLVTIGLGLLVAGIIASMLTAILGTYDLSF